MKDRPSTKRPARLPLLAIRDVVMFPHMALPLSVGRVKSIKALEAAMKGDLLVLAVTQKNPKTEDPGVKDFYHTGVVSEVIQFMRMPDNTLKVFLQGITRGVAARPTFDDEKGYWDTTVEYPKELSTSSTEMSALRRHALEVYQTYLKLNRRPPQEQTANLQEVEDASALADQLAAATVSKIKERQELLEILNPKERLEKLILFLNAEIEILNIEKKIHSRVRTQIEKTQKEYYLTEQMKAIQKELRQKDDFQKELDEFREKVKNAKMPKEAEEASLKEISRLEKMAPYSPESTVSRSYLDWMTALPWSVETQDRVDLKEAKKVLDGDHFGMKKAKDRILEYLAVHKLTQNLKGPILCFVGPPGVGKTSLGRSIAKATGRKFARIAFGGVRDESEIRGHRRTYIGSLPGRIIQALRKCKSNNPVLLLDEIDKMGSDWRGDPAAALLEVLDPEQNNSFTDHYLDVEYDLSKIMFVTTANTIETIPPALQDRLEIMRFPGYTQNEKVSIAKNHLIPKQVKAHGLTAGRVKIDDAALSRLLDEYTREAGVRSLEREIASLVRKCARIIVEEPKTKTVKVNAKKVPKLLGVPKYVRESERLNAVGVATGLAWTEAGGETLPIEVVSMPGKGHVMITGRLGTVMQESAKTALSYLKAHADKYGISPDAFKDRDFHLHFPAGAVPKDGPSAGLAIATAIASLVTGIPVDAKVAMTGEITLSGRALPIGGLKEKSLAAHREKFPIVLFPVQNKKDLEDIPADVRKSLDLRPVKSIDDVLKVALPRLKGAVKTKRAKAAKGRRAKAGVPLKKPSTPRPHIGGVA